MNLFKEHPLNWALITSSIILTALIPESYSGPLCLAIACSLLGLTLHLEQKTKAQTQSLETQFKALKERVDTLLLQKGVGR